MLLGEPPATQFDLHFQVLGIPVRVHPFFWLAGLIIGSHGDGLGLLLFVSAFFISILVHEMGHALMMRRFGMSSHVVLYMMGGLAIPDSSGFGRRGSGSREWILICAAGPGAGFLLAALIAVAIIATGGTFSIHPEYFPFFWSYELANSQLVETRILTQMVDVLLFINIFWGLINLAPVFPLDGGQIARQLMMEQDPWKGIVRSLWLSVVAGGVMAFYGFHVRSLFIAIMFAMLAVQSYLMIQQTHGGGGGFGRWR